MDPLEDTEDFDHAKRRVMPSRKFLEGYEFQKSEMLQGLSELWNKTEHCISTADYSCSNVQQLTDVLLRLKRLYENYKRLSDKYSSFLSSARIEGASQELNAFILIDQQRQTTFSQTTSKLEMRTSQLLEMTSNASSRKSKGTSKSLHSLSQRSSLSSRVISARADAVAARTQALCYKKEIAIKSQIAIAQAEADHAQAESTRKQAETQAEAAHAQAEAAHAQAESKRKQAEAQAESTRKQAETQAEAAHVQAEAARKQAEAQAQLELLQREREEAAAVARLEVLEQAFQEEELGIPRPCLTATEDPVKRTLQFVLEQYNSEITTSTDTDYARNASVQQTEPVSPYNYQTMNYSMSSYPAYVPPQTSRQKRDTKPPVLTHVPPPMQYPPPLHPVKTPDMKPPPGLNPSATPFPPPGQQYVPNTAPKGEKGSMSEFAKYMIRRELLNTGLEKFDDKPDNYRGWRATFRAAIKNLDIEPMGELDLLIRWLGPKSSEQAKRLKSANIEDPAAGLNLVWKRLEEVYGDSAVIELALIKRLKNFPTLSPGDNGKFLELSDLLFELESAKRDPHLTGLCELDTPYGLSKIARKLPGPIKEKWKSVGWKYKQTHGVNFPPFSIFCQFIKEIASTKNDPSFQLLDAKDFGTGPNMRDTTNRQRDLRRTVSVRKTGLSPSSHTATPEVKGGKSMDPNLFCPIHNKPHPLRKCRVFQEKPYLEQKTFLRENNICYRCCASSEHLARDCKAVVKCSECDSDRHVTACHQGSSRQKPTNTDSSRPASSHGGESAEQETNQVFSKCTEVCGRGFCGRSCAKICLVRVYPDGHPEKAIRMYVILDDQSNRSLASPKFFEYFNIHTEAHPYTLRTCAGRVTVSGRTVCGFKVAPIDEDNDIPLPMLIECTQLPNNRGEIPTPNAALHHPHLRVIAGKIPPLDENAEILILLGRDIPRVHRVHEQTSGPGDAPYAQKLALGWVIIGDVCLDRWGDSCEVNACKTDLEEAGTFHKKQCSCLYQVKHQPNTNLQLVCGTTEELCYESLTSDFHDTIFQTTCNDNKLAPSIEDREFVKIMDKEFVKDDSSSWAAPLPFRSPRVTLPNNRDQAKSRFDSLKRTLRRKPEMKEHFVAFMKKILENNHAERAPPLEAGEECWYLPSFGVYHPRKPGQIRVVFDSSAQFKGVSLNNALLTGPNLTNNLVGVLARFRKEPVAFMADVQQMFHCFLVQEQHRNYLRFFWHQNNDLDDEVIEYRMRVHVFGNSPSPAVATYGLRRTAKEGEKEFGQDVRQFIERDFYVDDCLKSLSTPEEAISLLKRTQQLLSSANLRLHKIVSNSSELMKAFDPKDHASDLKNLDLTKDLLPIQRSLGLHWDVNQDTFTFQVSKEERPFTKRGVLSTVNSLYDPLGFVTPITVQGRLILRQLTEQKVDWDVALPEDSQPRWEKWKSSLKALEQLHIPRNYLFCSLSLASKREIHIFSDASNDAIAAVAYLRALDSSEQPRIGFVLGRSKLAPKVKQTIPRLELCGAALAIEIADFLQSEMDIDVDSTKFYTDSKVVLGYIHNTTRRFYVYVANRVERIRKSSKPEQWNYVPTELNPADIATRPITAAKLVDTCWFSGPEFLLSQALPSFSEDPSEFAKFTDEEFPQESTVFVSEIHSKTCLGTKRFKRFSSWKRLTQAIASLMHIAQNFSKSKLTSGCHKWHVCEKTHNPSKLKQGEHHIIRRVQEETFSKELKCLTDKDEISEKSFLCNLYPIRDGGKNTFVCCKDAVNGESKDPIFKKVI